MEREHLDPPDPPVFEADDDEATLHGAFSLSRDGGGNVIALLDGVPLQYAMAEKLLRHRDACYGEADIEIVVR